MMASGMDIKSEDSTHSRLATSVDFGDEDSNIEDLSDHDRSRNTSALEYWLGKKHLDAMLARAVFERVSGDSTLIDLDSQFEKVARQFPYAAASKALASKSSSTARQHNIRVQDDDYLEFVMRVGAIANVGSHQEQQLLASTIGQFCNLNISPNRNRSRSSGLELRPPNGGSPPLSIHRPPSNAPASDMAPYTSWISERASREGVDPKWDVDRLTDGSGLFKAMLFYEDYTFEGWGKNRKAAKHDASREGCTVLRGQQDEAMRF